MGSKKIDWSKDHVQMKEKYEYLKRRDDTARLAIRYAALAIGKYSEPEDIPQWAFKACQEEYRLSRSSPDPIFHTATGLRDIEPEDQTLMDEACKLLVKEHLNRKEQILTDKEIKAAVISVFKNIYVEEHNSYEDLPKNQHITFKEVKRTNLARKDYERIQKYLIEERDHNLAYGCPFPDRYLFMFEEMNNARLRWQPVKADGNSNEVTPINLRK